MTKKKDKKGKIKLSDFPVRKAIYALRCGLEVFAIDWEGRGFIKGTVVATTSMTLLNEPGSESFYDIEISNGEVYEMIHEDDVFLTTKELGEHIAASFMLCDEETEG